MPVTSIQVIAAASLCVCGRGVIVGHVDGEAVPFDVCQTCLDESADEALEQSAPGAWSSDTCFCGSPLARNAQLCRPCEERADDEQRLVMRPARAILRVRRTRWQHRERARGVA